MVAYRHAIRVQLVDDLLGFNIQEVRGRLVVIGEQHQPFFLQQETRKETK